MYIPPNVDVLELWVNRKLHDGMPPSDVVQRNCVSGSNTVGASR